RAHREHRRPRRTRWASASDTSRRPLATVRWRAPPTRQSCVVRFLAIGSSTKPPGTRLYAQQRLDRAAFVHRAVAFRHLLERQREVEDLAGIDCPFLDQLDEPRKVRSEERRVGKEGRCRWSVEQE